MTKKKETPGLAKFDESVKDKNIYERINLIMSEVSYIQKEKKPGLQFSVVLHDAVTAALRPLMVKYGIVYHPSEIIRSQDGNRTVVDVVVLFTNINDPKDFIEVPSIGYGVDNQDKGPGKALSYAVKYALLKLFGLETGDDPDLTHDKKADYKPEGKKGGEKTGSAKIATQKQIGTIRALLKCKKVPEKLYNDVVAFGKLPDKVNGVNNYKKSPKIASDYIRELMALPDDPAKILDGQVKELYKHAQTKEWADAQSADEFTNWIDSGYKTKETLKSWENIILALPDAEPSPRD